MVNARESMPDPIPEPILSRAQVPPANGRPVRKDEIELHERGIYIESWLPERRSRRKPLLFVHGELAGSWVWERYLGYFAGRGWEGHALNLRNHYWSQTADPRDAVVRHVHRGRRRGPRPARSDDGRDRPRDGRAARAQGRRAGARSPAWSCSAPEPPRDLRVPARAHELREIPEVYGRSVIGWETLPEKLLRDDRDLTLADVLRIQHLLGQKPHEAGPRAGRCWPASRSIAGCSPRCRGWSSVAGSTGRCRSTTRERLAEWLDAEYEPFGAHSHYGLVVGEESYQQVADAIRGFLETNRL